ncbi:protein Gawky-like isoform X2 [Mya arenaria]|uniref:protein Gawky-like isoform X2 n=1 Tax=Mya arenaria TaxID=6604 RepID=UPI0022E8E3EE|nr:protein Gawky-like isoform X2 [Mya arenaria]XP_052814875.1 protein Gawky-like isoform X2 [Mya arenaria]
MQTPGASSPWGGSSSLSGLESNWGISTSNYSSGANNMNLLGYGVNSSLSNNQGHMQSGASSTFADNSSRGGWGAPGTIPPSQSTNKMPTGSIGNMQGSLPVSGAQPNGPQSNQQSGSFTTSQSPGPNGGLNSQGNSAFGNNVGFQKTSTGNVSSGLAINPATSIMNSSNGSSAQNSDNLGSAGWGATSSGADSRLTGTNNWGNPTSADWDQNSTSVSQNVGPNPQAAGQADPRPSSWAQAAGKGLNLQASNQPAPSSMTPEEIQRQAVFRMAIESHEGWGKKPIRQDTEWNVETSPKVQRKITTAPVVPEQQQKGTNNMWNNNNGTAIWEANKEQAWGGSPNQARAPGQPPANWPGGQKPPDPSGGRQWVGAPGQAPGPDKGSWGAPPNSQQGSGQWGGSTETGSWGGNFGGGNSGASSGISTWGDNEGTAGWGDSRGSATSDGTNYWGEPQSKPSQPNWNNAPVGVPPGPPAIGQNRMNKMGGGWGEPVGPPDSKIDDGTSLWQGGVPPQQPRPGNWGGDPGNQGQWNPTVGKPNPKLANQNPAAYGGVDDLNWNLPKEDIWSEESMGGWDDADMGTWNDTAAQTNSSWNSATGWNKDKRNIIAKDNMKFPGAASQQPQMRSRLLQQLMDMGFKKDEAQHALITNNMNIQSAVADLYNRRGASKKEDFDMGRIPGLLPDDDISDAQHDSSSFVPNLTPMQNTPFNNAQSKLPNQYPFNNGPSLNQSSLNSNNPSINNALQQKLMQKFQNQPPPPTPQSMNSMNPSQGGLGPGGQQNAAVHQQMAQQQILQQLRMAVQAGLISPQLLNRQLPTPVLVMLQQLLQQQQNLQQLITTQHMLQQNKLKMNPVVQRQQLEDVAGKVQLIKQQILHLQKNITAAQKVFMDKNEIQPPQQPPQQLPQASPETSENALQNELQNLSIASSQPQSRLNQWRKSTPDKDSPDDTPTSTANQATTPTNLTPTTTTADDGGDKSELNKTVGSKPIQQSNSQSNLRRFDDLGLGQLGGDSTWSSTVTSSSSQSWPNSSTEDDKSALESQNSSASTTSSSSSSVLDTIPAIPEFVPGKPWQGIPKNVEDDPHITPGSFARSLSVNTIKDDYLLTLTKSSPNSESNSSWPPKPQEGDNKPWSAGDNSLAPSSFGSEVWGVQMGKGAMSRPPPGLPQGMQQKWMGSGRGNWSGDHMQPSMLASTVLILQNLTPTTDGSTLRTLCMQHGPLQQFYLNLNRGEALVKYRSMDEASKAQKALNHCLLGNTTIMAQSVSEMDAMQYIEQQQSGGGLGQGMSGGNQWPQGGIQQARSSAVGGGRGRNDMGGGGWGGAPTPVSSAMWSAGGRPNSSVLWGGMEDTGPHNLLGSMLGGPM